MSLDERERRRGDPEKLPPGQQWSVAAKNLMAVERQKYQRAMQLLDNGTCAAIPHTVMFKNPDPLQHDLSIHQSMYTLDRFDVVKFLEPQQNWALLDAEKDDVALREAYNRKPQGPDPDPKLEFSLELGQIAVPANALARKDIAEKLYEELRMEIEHIQIRTYYRLDNTFDWQIGVSQWLRAELHNIEHLRAISHNTLEDIMTLIYGNALDPSRYHDISLPEIVDEYARISQLVKKADARLLMSVPPKKTHSVSPVNRLR